MARSDGSWAARIDAAEAAGFFDAEDIEDAGAFAHCAVGEQMKKLREISIDVSYGSHKLTNVVFDLGLDFDNAVLSNNFGRAREIMAVIEREFKADRALVRRRL